MKPTLKTGLSKTFSIDAIKIEFEKGNNSISSLNKNNHKSVDLKLSPSLKSNSNILSPIKNLTSPSSKTRSNFDIKNDLTNSKFLNKTKEENKNHFDFPDPESKDHFHYQSKTAGSIFVIKSTKRKSGFSSAVQKSYLYSEEKNNQKIIEDEDLTENRSQNLRNIQKSETNNLNEENYAKEYNITLEKMDKDDEMLKTAIDKDEIPKILQSCEYEKYKMVSCIKLQRKLKRMITKNEIKFDTFKKAMEEMIVSNLTPIEIQTKEIKENDKNKESPINKEKNKKNELTVKTEKKIEKKKLNYFLIEKYWYLTIQILNEINPENKKPDLIFDWSFLHSLLKQSLDEIPNRFLHLNLLQTIQKSIISTLNLKYLSKKIDYEFLDEFSALIEDSIIDISVLENINTFQNNEMEKKRIDKLYNLYLNFRKDYSNVDTKEEKDSLISNVWNDIIEIIPEINENQDKFKKNGKELRKELDKIFNHDSKNTQNNDSVRDEISNKINDLLMKYFEFNIVQKSNKKLSLAKETLEKLKEVIAVKENKLKILECIKQGRIDKNLFQIKGKNVPKHTIIIGRDCGLYILLNSLQDQSILYEDMPELKKYLKNLEYGDNKNKIIIGQGNFGKIRLALVLSSPLTGNVRLNQGDLICVKKTADFDTLYMHEIRENTLSDYFSEVDEKYVYSPQIIDMNIIITKEKKHCKGYTMQEFFPIKDATKFFKKNYNIRNWIHLKPYFIDIFNAIIELLNKGIAMTDLKPANTLYDEDYKVGKIIDLAGAVRKKDKNELKICPAIALKEFTILYTAPEILKNYDDDDNLKDPNEKIDLTKALSYSLGKMLFLLVDTQTIKQEIRDEVKNLASKMMHKDPLKRLPIEDGYEELKKIGEDLDEIRYFDFIPYMNYLKKNLKNEFETFGLKKNLEEIARLNLPTYVCELDPEKHEINISEIIDLKKTMELDEEKHQMRKSQIMKLKTEADLNPEKDLMRKSQMPDVKKESELDPEKNKIIKSQIIDINKEIDRFLNDNSNLIYKVFLLLGSAGTGKSTVLQLKYWELIKKWKVGDPFPFYMNLATGTNLIQKWKTFTKSIPGGERLMLKLFVGKSGLKLTLLLDSYDESRVKTNLIKDFIEKLQQNKNIKIIITCRSNYISNEEEEKIYFRYHNFPYLKRFIVPFNKTFDTEKEEIFENLINNYCESKFMKDKFQKSFENFKKFNLKEMMISNLMIFMILEILPVLDEKNDNEITNLDIYKLVSTESIEKRRKAIPSVINEKLKKNFGIKEDQEKEFYKDFANDLASQINGNKRESINNENNKEFFKKYIFLNPQKSLKNQSIFNNSNNIFKSDNITSFDIYKHFSTEAIQREKNKIPTFLKTKFQKDFGIKEEQELEFYTNFATDLALQLHTYKTTSINNEYNKEFFTKYNFNPHKSLKNQAIFNLIHTLSLNCEIEENNTVIISFQHETIKNYYLAKLILQEFNLNSTKTLKIHNFVDDTNLIILLTELTRKNENFANFLIHYVKNPQFKSDNQDELIDNASSNAITILIGAHVSFLEYNFINVCWRNADIRDGIFNGCDFSCSDLSGINIANCKFEKCIFTNTNLSKVKLGLFPNEEKSQKIVCIDLCVLRSNLHFKNSSIILHNLNDVLDNSPDSPKKKSTEEKGFWIASGISGFFYGKEHIAAKFEINHIIPGEINKPASFEMDLNSNIINSLCFSPDGNKLACCTNEKDIKIWEKNGPAWDFTAKQLPSLKGHTKSVCSVKFSPSSNYLISGGKDSKILLWRFSKEIEFPFDLKPETTNENLVCFYYDQKNSKIHLDTINSVCFSIDEKKILSGSKDNTINILHLENRICQKLTEHKDSVNSISVSRNGEFIVSGSSDKNIIIWGIKGNLIKIIPSHNMAVNSVCFSPDGKLIVSGSQDKIVKLWDRKSGNLLRTFEGHTDSVNCVLFSPHGNAIISGSNDQSIRFWDKNSGKIKKYEGHANIIHSISFSPDGKSVLSGSKDNTVKLWETKTGRLLKTFLGHLKPITSVGFSPIGNIIYSASRDKLIKFWNKETGKFITNISEIDENVNSAHFSSDEKYIVGGCQDGKLIIWENTLCDSENEENEADYKKVDELLNHKKSVNCVKFAYESQDYTIVSGSSDQTIKIWIFFKEKNKWEEIKTINNIYNSVYSVDFSNDGKYIVSGSDDFIVKIWDRKNGELIKDLKGHTDFINSVAFSKCGEFIISGSSDKTVKIWDVKTLELLFSYVGQSEVTSVDCSYYFDYNDDDYFHSKKEKIIAVGSQDIYFFIKSNKIPKLWNLNRVISKNETRMNVLGMKINKKCKISDINKKVLSQQGAIFE